MNIHFPAIFRFTIADSMGFDYWTIRGFIISCYYHYESYYYVLFVFYIYNLYNDIIIYIIIYLYNYIYKYIYIYTYVY